ncbi:hypothetical protein Pla111_31230 [Botrimarina hoheduenensis]|uniref:Uncharacterized protein n=1 Tax=Botrimarina hoheduenensis TaxID=2528000 RepID=A0A5C5VS29_9BACT|nr:hypothetical protein Pla111_31230 [Botrimarina hoheduenensis]
MWSDSFALALHLLILLATPRATACPSTVRLALVYRKLSTGLPAGIHAYQVLVEQP